MSASILNTEDEDEDEGGCKSRDNQTPKPKPKMNGKISDLIHSSKLSMQQRKCQANKGVVANSRSNGRSIYGMVQPKKQLAYLAEVLGVTVTYQDFPKKSEGGKEEVFSLVSISTKPPQVSIKD